MLTVIISNMSTDKEVENNLDSKNTLVFEAKSVKHSYLRGYIKFNGASDLAGIAWNHDKEERVRDWYNIKVLNELGIKIAEFLVPVP